MRIAHISDMHICSSNGQANIKRTRRLLANIVEEGFDHLVITGDVVHNPNTRDYLILRKILDDFDLLHTERLSLVIGNHEIHGGIHYFNEIFDFPRRSSLTNFRDQVNRFADYFPEAFDGIKTNGNEMPFPYVKTLNDMVIFGINSIEKYSLTKNLMASHGNIDSEGVEALRALMTTDLTEDKTKIVLLHHHFQSFADSMMNKDFFGIKRLERLTLRLKNKRQILGLFKDNEISLVLHGHVHQNIKYQINDIIFSNAGGSVDGFYRNMIWYNLITISNGRIEIELKAFEIEPEKYPASVAYPDFAPEPAD